MRIFASLIWAFIGSIIWLRTLIDSRDNSIIAALIGAAVVIGPLILTLRRHGREFDAWQARMDKARRDLGFEGSAPFEYAQRNYCIMLDPASQRMSLISMRESKVYKYGDVRSWQINTFHTGTGLAGKGIWSGIFIEMKDINFPQWRIAISSEHHQSRWVEILRQEINEGGAAPLPPRHISGADQA